MKTSTTTAIIALTSALLYTSTQSDKLYFFCIAFIATSFICQAIEKLEESKK